MLAVAIGTPRHLAWARCLAEGIAEHDPGLELVCCFVGQDDGLVSAQPEQFRQIPATDLVDPTELARLRFALGDEHAATLLRIPLATHLLREGEDAVVVLAMETLVTGSLRSLADTAEDGLALVPRFSRPPVADDRTPSPDEILAGGIIDPLTFAAGPGATPALDWIWRQEHTALMDPGSTATERIEDAQRLDLLGLTLGARIVDDPGVGVAFWNLHERRLAADDGRASVDGHPLVTLRLPGFDPATPYLLSSAQGPRARILLSDHPVVADLCARHADALLRHGHEQVLAEQREQILAGTGLRVDAHVRAAYRMALSDDVEPPPNPLAGASPERVAEWLTAPAPGARDDRVSNYLVALWSSRSDLRSMFPDPLDGQAGPFLDWVNAAAQEQEGVADALMPALEPHDPPPVPPATADVGVNVIGFLRAGFGVGEAARLLVSALESANVPFSAVSLPLPGVVHEVAVAEWSTEPRYSCNLVCINIDWMDWAARRIDPAIFADRYTIGLWYWESAVLPERLQGAFDLVDEVWVHSRFQAEVMRANTDLPVRVVPQPVPIPDELPAEVSRADLGLPEGFLFLFSYDFNSTVARKNPDGLVAAFTQAFEPGEGPVLVLKSIHGDQHVDELERLRHLAGDREDILIVDRFLPPAERDAWTAACDCYVSLHRSEGFGLTMAEAMALGKPVIATGYSGNLDFMTPDNSYLVRWRPHVLDKAEGSYPVGTEWADPDITHAAELMRRVFEDQDEARSRGRRAREDLAARRDPAQLGAFLTERLEDLGRAPGAQGDGGAAGAGPDDAAPDEETAPSTVEEGEEALPIADATAMARRYLEEWRGRTATEGVVRGGVLKAIRPHTAPQDHFNELVVSGLIQGTELASVRFGELGERLERLEEDHRAVSHSLRQRVDELGISQQDLRQRASRLERLQLEAAAHRAQLEEISEGHTAALRTLDDLLARLYPQPFVEPADALTAHGPDGAPEIGADAPVEGASPYSDFEAVFRGSEDRIRERMLVYLPILEGVESVLDVGCGRGEMLDILRDRGISASGVDSDPGMVAIASANGHDVAEGDAVDHLRSLPPGELDVVFCSHVIEHLPYDSLIGLMTAAHAALRPTGLLVAETVNPHCLEALKTFWLDLTHRHPIFPESVVVVARSVGFGSVRAVFPYGSGDLDRDRRYQDSYALLACPAPGALGSPASPRPRRGDDAGDSGSLVDHA